MCNISLKLDFWTALLPVSDALKSQKSTEIHICTQQDRDIRVYLQVRDAVLLVFLHKALQSVSPGLMEQVTMALTFYLSSGSK